MIPKQTPPSYPAYLLYQWKQTVHSCHAPKNIDQVCLVTPFRRQWHIIKPAIVWSCGKLQIADFSFFQCVCWRLRFTLLLCQMLNSPSGLAALLGRSKNCASKLHLLQGGSETWLTAQPGKLIFINNPCTKSRSLFPRLLAVFSLFIEALKVPTPSLWC